MELENTGFKVAVWNGRLYRGWAVLLSSKTQKIPKGLPSEKAAKVLRLTDEQADELFLVDGWPDVYQNRWDAAFGLNKEAQVAAERIDAFIRQYGLTTRKKKKVRA